MLENELRLYKNKINQKKIFIQNEILYRQRYEMKVKPKLLIPFTGNLELSIPMVEMF